MTATSITRKTALTVAAATMALGLAACGSGASDHADHGTKPAPALKQAAATTPPQHYPPDPHCFPAKPCAR